MFEFSRASTKKIELTPGLISEITGEENEALAMPAIEQIVIKSL